MINNISMQDITKKCIKQASFLKNHPLPLFPKEGHYSSPYQREVRRDFIIKEILVYG
jgi:hypothetical protein